MAGASKWKALGAVRSSAWKNILDARGESNYLGAAVTGALGWGAVGGATEWAQGGSFFGGAMGNVIPGAAMGVATRGVKVGAMGKNWEKASWTKDVWPTYKSKAVKALEELAKDNAKVKL